MSRLDHGRLRRSLRQTLALALTATAFTAVADTVHAASAVIAGSGPCASSYSLSQVVNLGGRASFALDISDSGWIVGTARPGSASRPQLPVRERGGQSSALDVIDGATFARAMGVNARGTAVGEAFTAAPEASRAVRWGPDGSIEVLPGLAGPGGVANAVNNRGDIVGASGGRAVIWPATGKLQGTVRALRLHTEREGAVSRAIDIDANGSIVGTSTVWFGHDGHDDARPRAILWSRGEVADLGGLVDDGASAALAIDAGHVVGEALDAENVSRAVYFDGGHAHALPALGRWAHSRANDVNADGVAVGHESRFVGNTSFGGSGVVWCTGRAVALDDLAANLPDGWTLRSAEAINETGQIVGYGSNGSHTVAMALQPQP